MDQTIYNITGIISAILTIATVVGGFLAMRKGWKHTTGELQKSVNDLHESAANSQAHAISALQTEMDLLRSKYENVHQENVRLQQVIQTICEALKLRDIVISIDGKMVNIRDNGTTTTTRISESRVNGVLELFDADQKQFGFISQLNSAPGVKTSQVIKELQFRDPRTPVMGDYTTGNVSSTPITADYTTAKEQGV